jgi:lauroyl/myristoyl acyltransferase
MSNDIQQIMNSQLGVGLAFQIGRLAPTRIGLQVATLIANQIASRRDWKIVKAVRTNQWVVSGETLAGAALDQAVRTTFHNTARSIFDLYHYIRDPQAINRLIVLDQNAQQFVQHSCAYNGRGLLLVGLHLSGFDLVLQGMCLNGFKGLVLTLPQPRDGRLLEFEMRKKTGMILVPTSVSALWRAVKHLRAGGIVLTGMDRPVSDSSYRPLFFNRPASLPTYYINLALKAQVPVMVIASIMHSDGKYHVLTSKPIEMQPHSDRETERRQNAEVVLRAAENILRLAPHQWTMTLPVWPEALALAPS